MSRTIDTTDPGALSDEDLKYLAERDQLPPAVVREVGEEKIQELLTLDSLALEDRANTGDYNASGKTKDDYEAEIAKLQEEADKANARAEAAMVKSVNIVGEYGEGWNNESRRNELEKRNIDIPEGANKAELIELLQDDDRDKGAVDEENTEG